jgi:hypothetical protein
MEEKENFKKGLNLQPFDWRGNNSHWINVFLGEILCKKNNPNVNQSLSMIKKIENIVLVGHYFVIVSKLVPHLIDCSILVFATCLWGGGGGGGVLGGFLCFNVPIKGKQ